MPNPNPLPDWQGEDVFIIGGGLSLAGFDFNRLRGFCTIGCNQAFLLGAEICNIAMFGDFLFWDACIRGMGMGGQRASAPAFDIMAYRGWVATNYKVGAPPPWLRIYHRKERGLAVGDTLGWNDNTGAAAINLALTLGAKRVFLLGFDMRRTPERSHWHDKLLEQSKDTHYAKFRAGLHEVAQDLPTVFPGREVINVTDGFSALEGFPRRGIEDVLKEVLANECKP